MNTAEYAINVLSSVIAVKYIQHGNGKPDVEYFPEWDRGLQRFGKGTGYGRCHPGRSTGDGNSYGKQPCKKRSVKQSPAAEPESGADFPRLRHGDNLRGDRSLPWKLCLF